MIKQKRVAVAEPAAINNLKQPDLYTRWAYETLLDVRACQEALVARSTTNAMDFSAALGRVMQEKVLEDPAFRDAAAMLFAGIDLPPEK